MKATHKGLGVKFGGACGVCGRDTGKREFERAVTALYQREDGKFIPVHPECAGGQTKNSNGVKYRVAPKDSIEVEG